MTETTQQIDWQAIISAIVALAGAVTLYLQNQANAKRIEQNTDLTQQAKTAAEQVQQATVDRLDYDRLRRMEAALQTLEACEPCRDAIMALTDRRRTYPHEDLA